LLRSLFDAAMRKQADWPPSRVQAVLAAVAAAPPRFALPPALPAHSRSYLSSNTKDPKDKSLVFDAFMALAPDARVIVQWPQSPEPSVLDDLNQLLAELNYLGRSESWVQARLLTDPLPDSMFNCVPVNGAVVSPGEGSTLSACPVSFEEYSAAPFTPPLKRAGKRSGKTAASLPLATAVSWLDALAFTTDDMIKHGLSSPPALRWIAYQLAPAEIRRSTRQVNRRTTAVTGVLYALDSKVLPRVIETVEVAERVRRKLMGIHRRIMDGDPAQVSPRFSGKEQDGSPMSGHCHAYYLPRDLDLDGRIDHLAVICRDPFDSDELRALDSLTSLWQRDGKPDINLIPVLWGAMELLYPSGRVFHSSTPFVLPRHHRKGRGEFTDWLAEEICREAEFHGFPEPAAISLIQRHALSSRSMSWIDFRRGRKGERERPGFGFILEFAEPVTGPLALGYGAHFGLGQFEQDKWLESP